MWVYFRVQQIDTRTLMERMCPAGAITRSGVYRHSRCMSLDRNCTCLTSLGLDHVKWNMRQLRAVRSRFTTRRHDFVLCGDTDYLNLIDTTDHILPWRLKQNRFSKHRYHTKHETMGNLSFKNVFLSHSLCSLSSFPLHGYSQVSFFFSKINWSNWSYVKEVCWMEEIQHMGHTSRDRESDTGDFRAGLTRAQNGTRHSWLIHFFFKFRLLYRCSTLWRVCIRISNSIIYCAWITVATK